MMLTVRLAQLRNSSISRWGTLLIRLALAAIFILSGLNKLPMQTEFVDLVKDFGILPDWMAVAYGYALPWVELLTGSYLLLGIQLKPAAVVSGLMSVSFLIANITAAVSRDAYCANCFGEFIPMTVPLAITVDVLVLIGAVKLFLLTGKNEILGFDAWFNRRFRNDD